MNASIHKKLNLLKESKFSIFEEKKKMPFKLFVILEQFLTGTVLITLTQLEKTGSTGKDFIPLEI